MVSNITSTVESPNDVRIGPFRVEYAAGSIPRTDEYRLRYRVFVEERHFLPADSCRDGLERDEFDDASFAFVLRNALTEEVAACQRMILPELLPSGLMTNIERSYRALPNGPTWDFAALSRGSWAEVSRSTIAPDYRWNSGAWTGLPTLVAIKYASTALAIALGRSTLLSLSEPGMARLGRRMGLHLHQIGDVVDFHGLRAPFRMDLAAVIRSVPAAWAHTLCQLVDEVRNLMDTTDLWRTTARAA